MRKLVIGAAALLAISTSALAIAPDGYELPSGYTHNVTVIDKMKFSLIKWLAGDNVVLMNVRMKDGKVQVPNGTNIMGNNIEGISFKVEDVEAFPGLKPFNKI